MGHGADDRMRGTRGRRRRAAVSIACMSIVAAGGCSDSDSAGPSGTGSAAATTTASATTAAGSDSDPTGSADPDTVPTSTPLPQPEHSEPIDQPATQRISFSDLVERELGGVRVTFTASAFFLEECPPPDAPTGPCSLLLFLADPDRGELLYGDRDQAVPGWIDEARVSCEVTPETRTACPGWTAGRSYEITGTVRIAANGRPEVHIDHTVPPT